MRYRKRQRRLWLLWVLLLLLLAACTLLSATAEGFTLVHHYRWEYPVSAAASFLARFQLAVLVADGVGLAAFVLTLCTLPARRKKARREELLALFAQYGQRFADEEQDLSY